MELLLVYQFLVPELIEIWVRKQHRSVDAESEVIRIL